MNSVRFQRKGRPITTMRIRHRNKGGGAVLGAFAKEFLKRGGKGVGKAAQGAVQQADEVGKLLKNKPKYSVNPQHAKGPSKVGQKTPLPADAEKLYENAIPSKGKDGKVTWWAKAGKDKIYRYFEGNDGTAHFSGTFPINDSTHIPHTIRQKFR